jgi:hypothetical protein
VPARLKKLRGWRSQTDLKALDSAKLFRNVLGLVFSPSLWLALTFNLQDPSGYMPEAGLVAIRSSTLGQSLATILRQCSA